MRHTLALSPIVQRNSPKRVTTAATAMLAAVMLAVSVSPASAASSALAVGPYAVLQGVLKKTIFKVEVARVQVRVDQATQRKLASIAHGRKQTEGLSDGAVRAVMATKQAIISAEIRRDVPYDKYVESTQEDLKRARASGLASEAAFGSVTRLLPQWFRTFEGRGMRKGDRFVCSVGPASMRVVYTAANGRKLVDRRIEGHDPGRAILASYFAPGSSFRKDLLKSVFH
jgi:hypothetical protein